MRAYLSAAGNQLMKITAQYLHAERACSRGGHITTHVQLLVRNGVTVSLPKVTARFVSRDEHETERFK
eukprot:COSAG06_NODE_6631_length_2848_cov_44.764278_4_plen_68_part_00